MSIAALNWAFQEANPATSSQKFVLVAIADCANDYGEAYPSIDHIVSKTKLNRKTILAAIRGLEEQGFLCDTGKRMGNTGQIPIYRVAFDKGNSPKNGPVKQSQKRDSLTRVTVPKTDLLNSPYFTRKQSLFYAETVPKTGHVTIRNHKGTNSPLPPKESPIVTDARSLEELVGDPYDDSNDMSGVTAPRSRRRTSALPPAESPVQYVARMEEAFPGALAYVERESEVANQSIAYRRKVWQTVDRGEVPERELQAAMARRTAAMAQSAPRTPPKSQYHEYRD